MDPGKKWTSGNSPSYWAEWEGSQLRDREFLLFYQRMPCVSSTRAHPLRKLPFSNGFHVCLADARRASRFMFSSLRPQKAKFPCTLAKPTFRLSGGGNTWMGGSQVPGFTQTGD